MDIGLIALDMEDKRIKKLREDIIKLKEYLAYRADNGYFYDAKIRRMTSTFLKVKWQGAHKRQWIN